MACLPHIFIASSFDNLEFGRTFSFPDFLSEVQENARGVLQAYLKVL